MAAGVGITFSDAIPYAVLEIRSQGPASSAAQQGLLNVGDVLNDVGGVAVGTLSVKYVCIFC